MKKLALNLTVFGCGAIVMILELSGSRIFAPYFGNSLFVWTSLIGIVLACLSLGYYLGGRLADRKPELRILAFIIVSAALSTAAIIFIRIPVLAFFSTSSFDFRVGTVLAVLVLYLVPGTLLGMVAPYAVRLSIHSVNDSGATVGRLYALSTIGSIVGTFLTGFVLLSTFNMTTLIALLALTLTLLATLLMRVWWTLLSVGFTLLLLATATAWAREIPGAIVDLNTEYSRIWIADAVDNASGQKIRAMMTDPYGAQSVVYTEQADRLYADYMRFFKQSIHFRADAHQALMIGGGGFAFPTHYLKLNPQHKIDVVEIDRELVELAKTYLGFKEDLRMNLMHQDARLYLRETQKKYAVIFVDAFSSSITLPFQLVTKEAAQLMHDALDADGLVFLNIVSSLEGNTAQFLHAEYQTFKSVFPQVALFPMRTNARVSEIQNIVLVAAKNKLAFETTLSQPALTHYALQRFEPKLAASTIILTDDFVPVETMLQPVVQAVSERLMISRQR